MQQARMPGVSAISEDRDTERVPKSEPRSGLISIDPERHSGMPCFAGTRVPIQDLWDYLEGGETLETFLDSFPSVSREQAIRVIRLAAEKLLDGLPAR